jgi:hypothetical protein
VGVGKSASIGAFRRSLVKECYAGSGGLSKNLTKQCHVCIGTVAMRNRAECASL